MLSKLVEEGRPALEQRRQKESAQAMSGVLPATALVSLLYDGTVQLGLGGPHLTPGLYLSLIHI